MPQHEKIPAKTGARDRSAEDLVRACARGEDAAWRLFLDRYGDLIYSVPLKMGVSRSDAEEVFQSSVLAMYQRLGTLRDANRLVAWICELARRQTLYYLRKRSRETLEEDESFGERPDSSPRVDEAILSLEESQLVREALSGLGPRCRELLTLLYLTDPVLAYKELAESLDIPIGSIGPTRARCLKSLRAGLAARGYTEGAEEGRDQGRSRARGRGES